MTARRAIFIASFDALSEPGRSSSAAPGPASDWRAVTPPARRRGPPWLISAQSGRGGERAGVSSSRPGHALVVAVSIRPARPRCAPAVLRGRRARGVRAHPGEAGAKVCPCQSEACEQRGTKGAECLFDGDAADVGDGHADHWKISVVQSPPWRRTSWARAGPSGRSWKSTKKSASIIRRCERTERSRLRVGVRFLLRCSPTLRA
jgi:hypothetical protein